MLIKLKNIAFIILFIIIFENTFCQTSVVVDPMANYTSIGSTINFTVKVNNVTNLYSYIITIKFNNSVVKFIDAVKGSFLDGNDIFVYQPTARLVLDSVVLCQSKMGFVGGVTGSGILFTLSFQAMNNGVSQIIFSNIDLRDPNLNQIPCTNMFGSVIIGAMFANVNIFLQGPYNSSSTNMNTNLNSSGYLPTVQPYNQSPWNYNGTESVPTGFFSVQTGIVDWVLVELRQTASGNAIAKRAALLKNDGSIVDCVNGSSYIVFTGISSGSYYLVVRHRNHLAVMSANAIPVNASPTLYSFSTGLSQFYGGDAKDLGNGVYGMYAGDVNGNGQIKYNGSGNDRSYILSILGGNQLGVINGYYKEDINLNGQVKYNGSLNDRSIILANLDGNQLGVKNSNVP